jgi:hypothetical protein
MAVGRVSFFQLKEVIKITNHFVKNEYFDSILFKVINSMFDVVLE